MPLPGKLTSELVGELVDAGSREHYADAALYDYEYRRRRADVTFYRNLARERDARHILELGAGSGRVTLPLARDGHRVVALDQAPAMLAKLRERVAAAPAAVAERITVARGDLRGFDVHGEFPLVIAAFNVLEHLYTRGEVDACLRCVADHLAPGRRVRVRCPAPRSRVADPRSDEALGARPSSPIRRPVARCSIRRTTTAIRSTTSC